jgi:hypothetical protein
MTAHCPTCGCPVKLGFGWDANPFVWVIEFKRIEDEGRKV